MDKLENDANIAIAVLKTFVRCNGQNNAWETYLFDKNL